MNCPATTNLRTVFLMPRQLWACTRHFDSLADVSGPISVVGSQEDPKSKVLDECRPSGFAGYGFIADKFCFHLLVRRTAGGDAVPTSSRTSSKLIKNVVAAWLLFASDKAA
jgi:hypothetical protein